MGKRAILIISEKQEFCAYSDQFSLASQQNITNRFSLWDNQSTLKHRWEIYENVRQGLS